MLDEINILDVVVVQVELLHSVIKFFLKINSEHSKFGSQVLIVQVQCFLSFFNRCFYLTVVCLFLKIVDHIIFSIEEVGK